MRTVCYSTVFLLIGFLVGIMLHRHNWVEIHRSQYSAAKNVTANWLSSDDARRIVFGGVIIELRCVVCGKLRTKEIIGASISSVPFKGPK